jgi:hypothetical protein
MTRTISFCKTRNALLALKATSKFEDAETIEVIRHIKSKIKTSVYVERKNRRTEVVVVNPGLKKKKECQWKEKKNPPKSQEQKWQGQTDDWPVRCDSIIAALRSFKYEPMRMKLMIKLLSVVMTRYAQKRPSDTEIPRTVGPWNGLITGIGANRKKFSLDVCIFYMERNIGAYIMRWLRRYQWTRSQDPAELGMERTALAVGLGAGFCRKNSSGLQC